MFFGPMDDSKYKDIVIAAMRNNLGIDKVWELLDGNEDKIKGYNDFILRTLGYQDITLPNSLKLPAFVKDESQSINNSESAIDNGTADDHKRIRDFLEKFYQIENCPSFLYHQAMLENGDYNLLMKIYSDFFDLEYDEDDTSIENLKASIKNYTKQIFKKCKTVKDEASFKAILE